jgi:AraC family transcriptional regulator, transcriptional activator of pobA
MNRTPPIAYVDLDASEAAEPTASLTLRRYVGATFRPPPTDAPHRHNYHELFIVQSGHGRHAIDGHSSDLLPSTVSFITKGQVHILEHMTNMTGWLLRWNDEFLPSNAISPTWSVHATLFSQFGQTHTLPIAPDDLAAIERVMLLIEGEWNDRIGFGRDDMLRHLLAALVIRLERMYQQSLAPAADERDAARLYQQFAALLEDEFARHHDVQFYATALGVSPVRLSRILSRTVGKTTKQVIDERIVLEGRRYLQYTDLAIGEIATALGYADLFHFSKTFKRVTGVAPQPFRDDRQKMT